jgi:hypothetical protein
MRVTALHLPGGSLKGSLPAHLCSRMDLAEEVGEEAFHRGMVALAGLTNEPDLIMGER